MMPNYRLSNLETYHQKQLQSFSQEMLIKIEIGSIYGCLLFLYHNLDIFPSPCSQQIVQKPKSCASGGPSHFFSEYDANFVAHLHRNDWSRERFSRGAQFVPKYNNCITFQIEVEEIIIFWLENHHVFTTIF